MKPARLSFAVVGTVASAVVGASLWPHARDALAILRRRTSPRNWPISGSILLCEITRR